MSIDDMIMTCSKNERMKSGDGGELYATSIKYIRGYQSKSTDEPKKDCRAVQYICW
ncbi:hypothetical protein EMIT019CA3_20284 [Bacillus pseudomycoides]